MFTNAKAWKSPWQKPMNRWAPIRKFIFYSFRRTMEIPAGRPYPYMFLQNAIKLQVYPMEAVVKIGDTLPDIEEGLNAGMWTIGLAKSGNEIGLTESEVAALDPQTRQTKLDRAYKRMQQTGAHFVVDSIADVVPLLDRINSRLAAGERP